jgi:hypothetical protein
MTSGPLSANAIVSAPVRRSHIRLESAPRRLQPLADDAGALLAIGRPVPWGRCSWRRSSDFDAERILDDLDGAVAFSSSNQIADHRNFYKVEKWTKDGSKVDHMLYAGSSLDKAREVFTTAIKHRPRIRLTIRQHTRALDEWPKAGP